MMNQNEAITLEHRMWKAAQNRDAAAFLEIVSPEAVMVCGGFRCTGKDYAEIIRMFDCKSYEIQEFEIVHEDAVSFQVHYLLKMEVEDVQNSDLAGTFHITTTWHCTDGVWRVVFNMDQRLA
ncbi:MAG: nuclear transport factor 2 family protein [Oscillospiraceae bacterium]|nr:nuclear transport factor 2 family protein [Oscillospiraceae bacterium]